MATKEDSTVRFEVTTLDWLRLLADVKPFAGTDDTLPTLNAIAFEFAGDDLLAVATDRYTLGVARLPIAATHVQPRRLLRLSDVDALAKMFKPARGLDPMLAIEFGTEGLAVETTLTLDGQPTMRAAFPWYDRTGLGWRSLAPTDFVAISSCAFNPKYLEKFTHIVRGAESVHLWPTHANKPWRVTVGDHFTGLIMPVRQEASDWAPAAMNEPPAPKVRAPRAKATATKKAAA